MFKIKKYLWEKLKTGFRDYLFLSQHKVVKQSCNTGGTKKKCHPSIKIDMVN